MEIVNRWRNDPALISQLGANFRYINPEVDRRWFENYMNNRSRAVRCAVCTEESDSVLGMVSLLDIDNLNQSGVFHIMIGPEGQGRGAGSFALREMLKHAFYNLNLQRVELEVLEENARARHVYEKAGFVLEGRKRRAVYKEGRFLDVMMYSILKEEFKE